MKRGYVEVPVRILKETEKALYVEIATPEEVLEKRGQMRMFQVRESKPRPQCWIPKSQIDRDLSEVRAVGDEGIVVIPELLYDAKMEEIALAYGTEDEIEERRKKGETHEPQ